MNTRIKNNFLLAVEYDVVSGCYGLCACYEPQMQKHHRTGLDVADLHKFFILDAIAGQLFWRARSPDMFKSGRYSAQRKCNWWNARYAGKQAGYLSKHPRGYERITVEINGSEYRASNIIFAMLNGEWPAEGIEVDHANKVSTDNRFHNLRLATSSQNQANTSARRNNKLGVKGVTRHKNKFRARITINGVTKHIGHFQTAEEAKTAYDQAAILLHGEFARSH